MPLVKPLQPDPPYNLKPKGPQTAGLLSWSKELNLGLDTELRADGIAKQREGNPRTDQHAITTHQATAVAELKEGVIQLIQGAAVLTEPGASR